MLSPRWVECHGFSSLSTTLAQIIGPSRPNRGFERAVRILLPNSAASELFAARLRKPSTDLGSIPSSAISSVDAFLDELIEHTPDTGHNDSNATAPKRADSLLREALLERAFDEAALEMPPPFPLRAGLIRRVLAFYDRLSLNHPVVPRASDKDPDGFTDGSPSPDTLDILGQFETRALEVLDAPDDVGAERLAAQTRFLTASLSLYRSFLEKTEHADPIGILRWVAHTRPRTPYAHLIILNADTVQVATLDAFSRLSGLEALDILSPKSVSRDSWQSGFWSSAAERLKPPRSSKKRTPVTWLRKQSTQERPDGQPESDPCFIARDREDSIQRAAKILKARDAKDALPPLDRIAIVVPKPLPYLYVAKKVLEECAIPYQLRDTFPLAAEPYVSAIDIFLEFCETGGRRESALALLSNPFFCFPELSPSSVSAFAALTLRYRELGGFARWRRLWEKKSQPRRQPSLPGIDDKAEDAKVVRVLESLLALESLTGPITDPGTRLSAKLDALEGFLAEFEVDKSDVNSGDSDLEAASHSVSELRFARARGGVREILAHWRWVVGEASDPRMSASEFRERVHRALEDRTFALTAMPSETGRVQIVDAHTAGFGEFDLVFLVGLNDTEWPSRHDRDVFYPQWFLKEFGWPSDHELLVGERRRFMELLELSGAELALIRHELEDDLPTIASPFLEDAYEWLTNQATPLTLKGPLPIASRSEALRRGRLDFVPPPRARAKPGILETKLRVPEPVSATSLETYLRCPFKYFSRYLLRLEEEETIDEGLNPLERGRLLHEILYEGFQEWDRGNTSPRSITVENFEDAMATFRRVAIFKLPGRERREELNRLFGTGGRPGAIEWILRRELSRPGLRKRLVEYGFHTPIQLREGPQGERPWFVQIKGRVDRADIDADGGLHVYDYKSGRAPALATTLQVPLYAMCLSQELDAPVREAAYLSLRDAEARRRADFEDASLKLKDTMGGIQIGSFGPKPAHAGLCSYCGYVALCRKEIEDYGRSVEESQ